MNYDADRTAEQALMYGTKRNPHFTQMIFTMSTNLQKPKTIVQRAMLFTLAEQFPAKEIAQRPDSSE